VLVAPQAPLPGVPSDSAGGARFRAALARDAVRADARGAVPPFWWEAGTGCEADSSGSAAPARALVAYRRDDRTGRELAERLVATAPAAGGRLVATGLEPEEFTAALARGAHAAYVVALPARAPATCAAVPAWPRGAAVTPLIETRAHAVMRAGAARVTVDADGALRVLGPAPAPAPSGVP
jgi:hypothetical protein